MQLWRRYRSEINWFHYQSSGNLRMIQGPCSFRPSWKVFNFPETFMEHLEVLKEPLQRPTSNLSEGLRGSRSPQRVWGLRGLRTSRWRQTSGRWWSPCHSQRISSYWGSCQNNQTHIFFSQLGLKQTAEMCVMLLDTVNKRLKYVDLFSSVSLRGQTQVHQQERDRTFTQGRQTLYE